MMTNVETKTERQVKTFKFEGLDGLLIGICEGATVAEAIGELISKLVVATEISPDQVGATIKEHIRRLKEAK